MSHKQKLGVALQGPGGLFLYAEEGSAHVDGAMSDQAEVKALGKQVGYQRC